MKISTIKTISEAEELAQIWYQRTKNLFTAASNIENPSRKSKAYQLGFKMQKRLLRLNLKILNAKNEVRQAKFPSGGVYERRGTFTNDSTPMSCPYCD